MNKVSISLNDKESAILDCLRLQYELSRPNLFKLALLRMAQDEGIDEKLELIKKRGLPFFKVKNEAQ